MARVIPLSLGSLEGITAAAMPELQKRLEKLFLKLDRMGLHVEEILCDALYAVRAHDVEEAESVVAADVPIDRQEVEIERECIRLLALYQPTAIDLRRICFVIKVNSDLERIADLAVSIAKYVPSIEETGFACDRYPLYLSLQEMVSDLVGRTIRLIESADAEQAEAIIRDDQQVDQTFRLLVDFMLGEIMPDCLDSNVLYAFLSISRALERIADLCTNIAEDMIFLQTGEIVRHSQLFKEEDAV